MINLWNGDNHKKTFVNIKFIHQIYQLLLITLNEGPIGFRPCFVGSETSQGWCERIAGKIPIIFGVDGGSVGDDLTASCFPCKITPPDGKIVLRLEVVDHHNTGSPSLASIPGHA